MQLLRVSRATTRNGFLVHSVSFYSYSLHFEANSLFVGSKSPGLIVLEHELSDGSVQAFMDAYPLMNQYGWTVTSVAQLNGGAWQDDSDSSSSSNSSFPLPGDSNDNSSSFPSSISASASATANSSATQTSTASAAGNSSASNQRTSSGAHAVGLHGKTIPTFMVIAAFGILAGLILV